MAIAHSCKELFSVIDLTQSLAQALGLAVGKPTINVSVHEDNSDALILAQTLPPQFTPRSKHYAAKTIWFQEEIVKVELSLLKLIRLSNLEIFSQKVCPRLPLNIFVRN